MSLFNSQRRLVASLSVCAGIAVMIKKRAGYRTPVMLCERVERAVDAALSGLTCTIETDRQLQKLEAAIIEFDKSMIVGREHQPSALLSFALGLLDEPIRMVTNPKRKRSLLRVESAIRRLLTHYDRRLDKFDCYVQAEKFQKEFDNLLRKTG